MSEKPLFIPLKTFWYNQFVFNGRRYELRKYGPRWNEKTCRVGRAVTLSKGYGKKDRTSATITAFEKLEIEQLGATDMRAALSCGFKLGDMIAKIHIEPAEK